LTPFSGEQLRFAIEEKLDAYIAQGACKSSDKAQYSFGVDFIATARGIGLYTHCGPTHLLAESCARIVIKKPKYELNPFQTRQIQDGWKSYRTHLTKGGAALRLMLWVKKGGGIVFANVGEKAELEISENVEGEAAVGAPTKEG
jgi:hypothetical protein